jgi:hypothetical protein
MRFFFAKIGVKTRYRDFTPVDRSFRRSLLREAQLPDPRVQIIS